MVTFTSLTRISMYKSPYNMKNAFHIASQSICIEYGKTHIPFAEITHLEGIINYTIIHTNAGKAIVTAFTLKKFEEIIEKADFIRTHKSFIVNPLYLGNYLPEERTLTIIGNKSVQVSRRMRKNLEHTLSWN
jgi:DNA-binding LytR/AlgR family response regulator